MKSSLERERELSYKILSEARAEKEDYNSLATRHTLSDAVTALYPAIMPYDWQVDLAEALNLGLDATVIAGTGSGKTLPWVMPLLLEQNHDRIKRARGRSCIARVHILKITNLMYCISVIRLAFSPRSSGFPPWP